MALIENRWNEVQAASLQGLDLLVYRSNLLGADRAVCNWGGGNTSTKGTERDFKGSEVETVWVKGSGSDLATITRRGFTALRLPDARATLAREAMSDQEMVTYLQHCMLDPSHPRASIETLLHVFLPFTHIDHSHPDAILGLGCTAEGEALARKIFGSKLIWLAYIRPGFTLSKQAAQALRDQPKARLIMFAKHGLVTWGDTSRECYNTTIDTISQVEAFLQDRLKGIQVFGGLHAEPLPDRREIAAQVMPTLRGAVSRQQRATVRFDDSPPVLELVQSQQLKTLALTGSACPDHLVHTKHWPMIAPDATGDLEQLKSQLTAGVAEYISHYQEYFKRHATNETSHDPAPRVILVPNLGMFTTGKDLGQAILAGDLYHRAIQVMRRTCGVGRFVSLTEAEAFAVEYWPLELYKLTLRPPEQEFSRQVAIVTGGASGIGRATARALAKAGAHVAIFDINTAGAQQVTQELVEKHGPGCGLAVTCDVTDEAAVVNAFQQVVLEYGGVDLVVSNAGLASSSPIENTTLADWRRNIDVLATGYFLVAREAFRLFKQQGIGGNLIFVASKNALVAGRNAGAYSASKAAELHLARCLAEEGGAAGIRVNTVCPDAVLEGSSIWNSQWRAQRAKTYGIAPGELERYYRERTTLRVNVFPEDVAEAILFLASSKASKTTGAVLSVDGGVPAAFPR